MCNNIQNNDTYARAKKLLLADMHVQRIINNDTHARENKQLLTDQTMITVQAQRINNQSQWSPNA